LSIATDLLTVSKNERKKKNTLIISRGERLFGLSDI
jgi:hypothetical protein